ncbi:hypothetical protein MLD38_027543 [Melastoma candidum]|uniref:Uncharacterized protein n=1 Tax=Melastoma candidum TaxID=119954 RepID=A0ACB9P245_9MYRT|nr:hypothetical protein MLD38_027543 [Melastoma candidum]
MEQPQPQVRKRKLSEAAQKFQGLARPPPPPKPLQCPRCNSMSTKFCYYNNYSLSQPRHFCKDCRRYWTHGGNCRNIPVGGNHSKKARSKGTITSEAPSVDAPSLSATSGETSLQSNAHPVPAVTPSGILSMPPQPAGGYKLPSYSSANDRLLSPVIGNPLSLDYQQDTFNSQLANNNNLLDGGISFDSNLGFMKGFDAGFPIASPINDYGLQLQPAQLFQQDVYMPNGMNAPEAANWSGGMSSGGGIGGSSVSPTDNIPYTTFPGYGYPSNSWW